MQCRESRRPGPIARLVSEIQDDFDDPQWLTPESDLR